MRFVVAILLFVVSLAGIGLGVAQRTILAGPDHVSASVTTSGDAPLTIIDGTVLTVLPGTQTVEARGSEQVFLAYGRSADVRAWVGDLAHNVITWDPESQDLVAETVAPPPPPVIDDDGGLTGPVIAEEAVEAAPSPVGSDLWVQEFVGVEEITRLVNVPADASILIAADGQAAAPSRISLTWPLDNSAPWSGPLIVGGSVALLLGLLAFVWALHHARRGRGPRRKQPKLPKPPKPPQLRRSQQRAPLPAGPERSRRRLFTAGGLALAGALVLTSCAASDWPQIVPVATPTASPVPGAEGLRELPAPAVTGPQLNRIVDRIVSTIAEADAQRDEDLAATRLAGPALQLRAANYVIRTRDSAQAALSPIPDGPVEVILPQQYDGWPRTVFAVATDEERSVAPAALMLIQDTPRDNYRVHFLMSLEPRVTLPQLAATAIGAPRVSAEQGLWLMQPSELATAYGDILLRGDDSEYAEYFEADGDSLRLQIGKEYKADFAASLPSTASIEFTNAPGTSDPIAFGTNDSGVLVATELIEIERVTPAEVGAAINPRDSVRALVGTDQSTTGIEARYGVQLLFYVPPLGEPDAKIILLGFTQGLASAGVL